MLPHAISNPDCIIRHGSHKGYKWVVINNRIGYRCGYVKVHEGHPWYGADQRDYESAVIDSIDCHGGITYTKADKPVVGEIDPGGWWLGFDCAHAGDAADPSLIKSHDYLTPSYPGDVIRDTDYVQRNCEMICEQAWLAKEWLPMQVESLMQEIRNES